MRVQLNNVGVVKECDVEFVPGVNLIIGSSGSGKSTLMRSIYNTVSNNFSDGDISFGENTMTVKVDDNNNSVEYSRSVKTKGDKCYYKVNGEYYVKLGRTPLQAVTDVIKIGSISVNGEDINFNFNLQFSAPFLILGSQSTLYNVLTYRSSFDISSINDYYSVDVKNNASDILMNVKLKEQFENNLEQLESQADNLSGIEQLYGDYILYKHHAELSDELIKLVNCLNDVKRIEVRLNDLHNCIESVNSANENIEKLIDLLKYNEYYKHNLKLNTCVSLYNNLTALCENTISRCNALSDVSHLHSKMIHNRELSSKISSIDNCLHANEVPNDEFIKNISEQQHYIKLLKINEDIITSLSSSNDDTIIKIDELYVALNKLNCLKNTNTLIKDLNKKLKLVNNKLSEFDVCPLCGKHIDECNEG